MAKGSKVGEVKTSTLSFAAAGAAAAGVANAMGSTTAIMAVAASDATN